MAAVSMDQVQGETLSALQAKHDRNALNPSEIATGVSEICQTLEDATGSISTIVILRLRICSPRQRSHGPEIWAFA